MSHRDTPWPAGTPCWVDIAVPDLPAATAFYGAVLGWTFVDSGEEFGHYNIAQVDGRAAAAIGPIMQEGTPTVWTVYLASEDADATAKLITENGGTLLFPPMEIPGSGRMSVALDPDGGAFGVWQALGMNGFGVANEPGSVTWTDARLTDVDAGKEFYSAVFGYTYQPVPGAPDDYGTVHAGGDPVGGMGGMMGGPSGAPAHWLTYFAVADADAAVAAAQQGGGSVVMPLEDTPFGRMGVLTDPFGATFAVVQLPAEA
jgi:predicted enzyme related to lactoylglutathione lyase